MLCILLCQACTHLESRDGVTARTVQGVFHFDDGGQALFFVLDKPSSDTPPRTFMFVIAGSDCASMRRILPQYFDGLSGSEGGIRIFILHKRFIATDADARCSDAFMRADHPSRWIADQGEFIRHELSVANASGHPPERVLIAGISEGAEIAPIIAHRVPDITHVALIGNGGMDPFDAYRLQAGKHGFMHALEEIEQKCSGAQAMSEAEAAERSCRYWTELRAIRHTDNLLALDLPVFVAMGEADTMVPIESAWLIQDKFNAHRKNNLRLMTFAGTGHDFRRNRESVLPYLWDALEIWMKK